MKKLLLFSVLAVFLSFGCQDKNPIEADNTQSELSKAEPNWITLPDPIEKSLSKTFSNGEWIAVNRGGRIKTEASYWTFSWWSHWNSNRTVTAVATLDFPSNAWDKETYGRYEYITLSIDDNTATSSFDPHMEFKKPVIYNAKFTGLNLTGIDPSSINFVYQDPSGSVENVEYDALRVDVEKGVLEIVNAKIPHFSRYGFTW